MKLTDIPHFGWQYVDNSENKNILFLSFIDILKYHEKEKENEEKK